MKKHLVVLSAILLSACLASTPPADEHAVHSEDAGHSMPTTGIDRLNDSPRHQEWVTVKNGDRSIRTFVVYPETNEKVPTVLVIHENKGLNDWARGLADQVAEAGYIAVAPDLLSQFDAAHADTAAFASDDERTKALMTLDPAQVMSDLQAVADWAKTIPASSGKIASAGFCWGGSQSFRLATQSDDLATAMVFYGTGPADANVYENIDVPVVAFYGGADERVNATIAASEQAMKAAGKTYDYVIYEGAGHAFMRSGEDPKGDAANVAARNAAWARMKEVLSKL